MSEYRDFLATKHVAAPPAGFAVPPATLNPALFPFQRDIVGWALERGRAAAAFLQRHPDDGWGEDQAAD
jgi:hypothetical protein